MTNLIHYFALLSGISILVTYCEVQFIPERVKVVYVNEKYFNNYTWAVKRYGRNSGYYLNVVSSIKHEWNNNVTFNLVFNEFLHNEYRRSFVELHYKFCDLLKNEKIIGPRVKEYGIQCPLPVGTYYFMNLTIPLEQFPSVFPYERARMDIEYTVTSTRESMAKVYLYCMFKNKNIRYEDMSVLLAHERDNVVFKAVAPVPPPRAQCDVNKSARVSVWFQTESN